MDGMDGMDGIKKDASGRSLASGIQCNEKVVGFELRP